MLGPVKSWPFDNLDWIIIGAQTNPYRPPKPEWVQFIIDEARLSDIPLFLKDNLRWAETIQEWPEVEA